MQNKIEYIKQIGGHAAFEFVEAAAKVHASFYPYYKMILPSYDDEAVLFYKNDTELEGVVSFRRGRWNSTIMVSMSYVNTGSRRNRIHTALIGKIEGIAKRDGYNFIARTSSVSNEGMIEAIKSQGYRQVSISFEKVIDCENSYVDLYQIL